MLQPPRRPRRARSHAVWPALLAVLLCGSPLLGAPAPRVLRARGDHDYPPYEYLENGRPTGFNVELLRAVAEVMGLRVDIRLGPWSQVRTEFEQGQVDLLTGMYYSPERARTALFAAPHSIVPFAIVVPRASSVASMDDLRGREVVVQQGDIAHEIAQASALTGRLTTVPEPAEIVREVALGEHDAGLLGRRQALHLIDRFRLRNLHALPADITPQQYGFAVAPKQRELVAQLNEGLALLRATGRLAQLEARWFGTSQADLPAWVTWAFGAAALLLGLALLWSWSLRRLVQALTSELREVIDLIPHPIFARDSGGRLLLANRALGSLLGRNAEQLQGQRLDELWRSGPLPRFLQGDPEQGESPGEETVAVAEGQTATFQPAHFPLSAGPAGGPFVLTVATDVTSLRQAEAAQRASEVRFAKAFRTTPVPLAITRVRDGLLVEVNDAFCKALGYTREQAVGHRTADLGVWPSPSLRAEFIHESVGQAAIRDRRMVLIRRDGEEREFSASTELIEMAGEPHVLTVARDITEERRAAERLRRLAVAVEQVDQSIIITDDSGLVEYVNPAVERMFGYRAEDMIGKVPRLLDDFDYDAEVYPAIWEAARRGEAWRGRLVALHSDGRHTHQEVTVSAIRGTDNRIVQYVAVLRDVEQELRLQEQLRQASKMEAVGQLAGGVAHDFNNLLTTIGGYGELIADTLEADDPRRDDLAEIIRATERATALTGQLLAFSRKQVIDARPLDLNEVVRDMERMLRRLIGEHIELETRLADELGTVVADQSHLEQLLLNLAVNARDAMPEGGRLLITTANVTAAPAALYSLDEPSPGPHVLLSVRDNGSGMDEATRARMYEPFFTTKGRAKGTGLGLATVYGIVKQNGGVIECESARGEGTTFRIYLPRASQPAGRPDDSLPALPAERGGGTILVVEDEPAVRSLAARVLSSHGYQVLAAADGHEALELAGQTTQRLDAVLSDVVMPGMDGPELARQISTLRPEVPVLFMSGYAESALVRDGVPAPGVRLVTKPFTPLELVLAVEEVLRERCPGP